MAVCKCKMCGGDLTITELDKIVTCEYCGTTQTVPSADNEKKMTLFNRANRLRMNSEFDKAAGIYENIIAEFPEEAEAYWGALLCKYGIEYVDDPATGEKKPTCHRASFEKAARDEYFELAMEYADVTAQKVYRDEAREIDRINEEILSISRNEQPYDIFICYKETDESGNRTPDSVMAQDIYDALTGKGYKVFFSRITLEDKLGLQYEPYIFAALNSAKIMLCVGTKYEYFHAVWVKNEWSRFLRLAAKDKTKVLIPCYRDMDPYDMPDEFCMLQAQDLGKLGAMQDLTRGIAKILGDAPAPVAGAPVAGNTASPLLKRAFLFLEDGDWENADAYAEKVLDQDPETAEAYLVKAMAERKIGNRALLGDAPDLEQDQNIAKILRFGGEEIRAEIEVCLTASRKAGAEQRAALEQQQSNEAQRLSELAARRAQAAAQQNVLSAGLYHVIELTAEGRAVAFGDNERGQCNVSAWTNLAAVAAGGVHSVGLRRDGQVVAIGENGDGQCCVSDWQDIVAVAAGDFHTVGLRRDGTVLAVGEAAGQCNVEDWRDIVAVAAGTAHTLGLRRDGTVLAVGDNSEGQCNVADWRDIVAVAAGAFQSVGIRLDGTVLAVGYNGDGECAVSDWTEIVAVAVGDTFTVGLKGDGTVVMVGALDAGYGLSDWRNIVAVSACGNRVVGLCTDGSVLQAGYSGADPGAVLGGDAVETDQGQWFIPNSSQRLDMDRQAKIAELLQERDELYVERSAAKGRFRTGIRKAIENRINKIDNELHQLDPFAFR